MIFVKKAHCLRKKTVGSEITGKLFTKTVRGLPSGFSQSVISKDFRPVDIQRKTKKVLPIKILSVDHNPRRTFDENQINGSQKYHRYFIASLKTWYFVPGKP